MVHVIAIHIITKCAQMKFFRFLTILNIPITCVFVKGLKQVARILFYLFIKEQRKPKFSLVQSYLLCINNLDRMIIQSDSERKILNKKCHMNIGLILKIYIIIKVIKFCCLQ